MLNLFSNNLFVGYWKREVAPLNFYLSEAIFHFCTMSRFVVLGGCSDKQLAQKAKKICDITQYPECQVTLAINLVTQK